MKRITGMFEAIFNEPETYPKSIIKPGLVVPGMRCKLCGLGQVEWLSGGSWILAKDGVPLPHYLCYNCHDVFHVPPKRKRIMKTPAPWNCFRLP